MVASILGIDISNKNIAYFVKHENKFFSAKNIGLHLSKRNGEMKLRYKVDDCYFDTLYVQDNGFMHEAPKAVSYTIHIKVGNYRTDRFEIHECSVEDGKIVFYGWVANGIVEKKAHELADGEYDGELMYSSWFLLDLGLKAENVGFLVEDSARFFNSYYIDNEPHMSLADKVCPSKDKQEIGLTAIHNLFKILKMNGLRLVYSDSENALGIINDVEVKAQDYNDEGSAPHHLVVPILADENPLYVSEGCSFKVV